MSDKSVPGRASTPRKSLFILAWTLKRGPGRFGSGFWEWRNPDARDLVKQLLGQAAPAFGNGRVKEDADDGHIDLRGTCDGVPMRFSIWMSFGSFWGIYMRFENHIGELEIERDHEKIPKERVENDPWDDNEERRIFLAKGIFVEGYDRSIEKKLEVWSKLPADLRAQILRAAAGTRKRSPRKQS